MQVHCKIGVQTSPFNPSRGFQLRYFTCKLMAGLSVLVVCFFLVVGATVIGSSRLPHCKGVPLVHVQCIHWDILCRAALWRIRPCLTAWSSSAKIQDLTFVCPELQEVFVGSFFHTAKVPEIAVLFSISCHFVKFGVLINLLKRR